MSNPLTTPQYIETPQTLLELLNVVHDRPFSLLFVNYSWLLAAAGCLSLIWVFHAWRGQRDGQAYTLAMPLTVALILAGFLNVLAEVQQPSRLLYGFVYGWQYWDTSIIKYGIILLPSFLLLSWWMMFQSVDRQRLESAIAALPSGLQRLADFFSLWSRRFRLDERPRLRKAMLVIMFLLSIFAPLYSGIFLMNEHGVPIWNSPAQPLLFLASGIASAAVLLMLVVPVLNWLITGEPITIGYTLRPVVIISIVLSAVIWFGWMWWLARFGGIAELRAVNLFMGPYANAVFWHWVFAALLLPLAVYLSPLRHSLALCYLAGVGILWGSYALRAFVLIGGQAINRSGAGYLEFTPNLHTLWYIGFSVLFLVGILALLLLVLPLKAPASAEN